MTPHDGLSGDYKRGGGAGQADRSIHSDVSEEHIGCCNDPLSEERITLSREPREQREQPRESAIMKQAGIWVEKRNWELCVR